VIDPRADGIASHQPCAVGFEQIGRRSHISHPRIEPEILAVWIENQWHAVADCGGQRVWSRSQNRAGLDPTAARVSPAIPYPRECEQRP
jgi:hypothetical protein